MTSDQRNKINDKQTVCSACINLSGGCCVGVTFNVHRKEADIWLEMKKNGFPENHTFVQDKDDKDQYLYNSSEERCVYLNENNACSIYDDRPLMCRIYPILFKKYGNYFIDMICPLVHYIPLREIAMWPDDPRNKEMIKIMEELDFDGRSRQYINLKTLYEMNNALEIVKQDLRI